LNNHQKTSVLRLEYIIELVINRDADILFGLYELNTALEIDLTIEFRYLGSIVSLDSVFCVDIFITFILKFGEAF
jgi:hypothetical protein